MTTQICSKFVKLLASIALLFFLSVVGYQGMANAGYIASCTLKDFNAGKCAASYSNVKMVKVAQTPVDVTMTAYGAIPKSTPNSVVYSGARCSGQNYDSSGWIFRYHCEIPLGARELKVKHEYEDEIGVYNSKNELVASVRVDPSSDTEDALFEFYN